MSAPVAIIGTGNLGCSFAVDLLSRNVRVIMWACKAHRSMFDKIKANGKLENTGDSVIKGSYRPELTTELSDCIRTAKTVLITVPAGGHGEILGELEKHDLSNHTLIAVPGTFFALAARKRGIRARHILETATAPYGCRIVADKVFVKSVKQVIQIASLPTILAACEKDAIAKVFPQRLEWRRNVLEIGLMCTNGVGHPPAAIMNAGRIESTEGDFHFYREGMTPFVGSVTETLDDERRTVAAAFGIEVPSVVALLNLWYNMNAKTYSEFARETIPHNQTKGAPTNMYHRYITEDVPYLLVPWSQLGKKAAIQTPTMDSIIHMASAGNKIDYVLEGRNLSALGIEACSVAEIMKIVA